MFKRNTFDMRAGHPCALTARTLLTAALATAGLLTIARPAAACMQPPPHPPPIICKSVVGQSFTLEFQEYKTFGGSSGQYCSCGLKRVANLIQSVDSLDIIGQSGFNFSANPTTSSEAGSILGSPSTGFLANISSLIPAGQAVKIKAGVTLFGGKTCADVQTEFLTAGLMIVTDEGFSSGAFQYTHNEPRVAGPVSNGGGGMDPHMRTFDQADYDFFAEGEFDAVATDGPKPFIVQIRSVHSTRVITAAAMSVNGDRVGFYLKPEPHILVNGEPAQFVTGSALQGWPPSTQAPLPSGGIIKEGTAKEPGDQLYEVVWPEGDIVRIWFRAKWIDLHVFPPAESRGNVGGLLGSPDGNIWNDMKTRDGEVLPLQLSFFDLYRRFAESWRITNETSLFDYGPGEDTSTFTDRSLPREQETLDDLDPEAVEQARAACTAAGVVTPILLDNCTFDVAASGDSAFINSYADAVEPLAKVEVGPDGPWAAGCTCTIEHERRTGLGLFLATAMATAAAASRQRRRMRKGGRP